jgi:hypothetical protein
MQGAIHQGTALLNDETVQTRQEENSPVTVTNQLESNQKVHNEDMSLESTEIERLSSNTGNEDAQSSSCVINVDMGNSTYEYGDGDSSSVLSSKTCSVEDVSLTAGQDEVKNVTLSKGCEEKVRSEVVLEEVKQEPKSAGTIENVAVSVEVCELSNLSSSVSVEEEEEMAALKQAESQDYINPRGVRFMSQEIGQDGKMTSCLVLTLVIEIGMTVFKFTNNRTDILYILSE